MVEQMPWIEKIRERRFSWDTLELPGKIKMKFQILTKKLIKNLGNKGKIK